jgi:glutathione S-transferase
MIQANGAVLEVFGRTDSSAVARVMWTVGELGIPHKRTDIGGPFGGTDEPGYRTMNPTGRIPAVRLSTGEALWESNAIIRYLASVHNMGGLTPSDPVQRAQAEAWMDWSADFQSAVSRVRQAYKADDASEAGIRTAFASAARVMGILEHRLAGRSYVMGDRLTIADLSLGVWAHRWFRAPEDLPGRPVLSACADWYARLLTRAPFVEHVADKVSAGPQRVGGG